MEIPVSYNESVVLTSVVNGLLGTAVLWTFWTPFILFLVVPLVNAQIKQALCKLPIPSIVLDFDHILLNWLETKNVATQKREAILQWIDQILRSLVPQDGADVILQRDTEELLQVNENLYVGMIVSAVVIVVTSIATSVWMIQRYNLNGPHILQFNLVMALVIMLIEMVFFSTIAMSYIPFDATRILSLVIDKINAYLQ